MRKRILIFLFAAVLTVQVGVQILLDHNEEMKYREKTAETLKSPRYSILIEIDDKTLYLLQDGKCIKRYPIASGKTGWPSPIGYWKIVEKGDWGEGFGGRWMGLNVTWGIYGIHGTSDEGSIGSAASHGCIRMFNDDAKELYNVVSNGTPVAIVEGSFGPFGRGYASLMPGDRGADVMAVQQRLRELGYLKGPITGIYDEDTKQAVHKFESDRGLPLLVRITKECWNKMGFTEFE